MRVNPIHLNYQKSIPTVKRVRQVNFEGKHDCAKFLGGVCGGLGTLGALGGIAIMTGGVSLIPTLAYGALCTGIGAAFGHAIDKSANNNNQKE